MEGDSWERQKMDDGRRYRHEKQKMAAGGGQWRRREEGEEGRYLLLMAVRVSEGWRAIQL